MKKSDCCGAVLATLGYEDGAYETLCDVCSKEVCSECAATFEAEGGYGDDGQGTRTHALCNECAEEAEREAERDYRRQMREWRNDSGV